jgi:UDP-2-acetamido-3-amino-2,3-dideoxy-glucuronate N-acetyltransferase
MSDYFVHESSYIDEGARSAPGRGSGISAMSCRAQESANAATSVRMCWWLPDVTIGNNVKIQNNVSLYTGVIVEDDAFLGPSMVFTNVINPRSHVSRKDEYKTTLVRKGAIHRGECDDRVRNNAWEGIVLSARARW